MFRIELTADAKLHESQPQIVCAGMSVEISSPLARVIREQTCIGDCEDELVEDLAVQGFAYLASSSNLCHYTEVLAKIVSNARVWTSDADGDFLPALWRGHASRIQVIGWIRSMFAFTNAAVLHVGEIRSVATSCERDWEELFLEEASHWNIYRRIFAFEGIDISKERLRPLKGAVKDLVDLLSGAARVSEFHYAALLYLVEQGPGCDTIDDDPVFSCLFKHYGFPKAAVSPLFLHTLLNEEKGHSDLWRKTIAGKRFHSRLVLSEQLELLGRQIDILSRWSDDVRNCIYC